ncbi:MAG: hypothetical protein FWG71_01865 [Synergistaceae bacterium]|nr:hypothetical protein [Synergistaceae bacterium]
MQTIAVEYAREHFSDLLNQIETGESFAIIEQGKIRAVLHPTQNETSKSGVIAEFKEYVQKRNLRLNGLSVRELREEGRRG